MLSCLAFTLILGSFSNAWGQGLKGFRYNGWPPQEEFEPAERAVKLHPDSIKNHEELAEMYYYRGEHRKSIKQFQEAIRLRLVAEAHRPDLEGLAEAYSNLGFQLSSVNEFPDSEAALTRAIKCWKTLIGTDKTGNAKYRLELDLDRLTECYADWGKANLARKTYAQLIEQMNVPNDCHDNIYDLQKKLRAHGIIRSDTCPPSQDTQSHPLNAKPRAKIRRLGSQGAQQSNSCFSSSELSCLTGSRAPKG